MNFRDNENINLVIDRSDLIVSNKFGKYINEASNIMKGFYLSFSLDSDTTSSDIEFVFKDRSFKTSWVEVMSTSTSDGIELYIDNSVLPLDYMDQGTEDLVGEIEAKYKYLFIGYKDILRGSILPIIRLPLGKLSVVYDVNTTINFKADIKCNYFLNETSELEHIPILESSTEYEDEGYYNIIQAINQLNNGRDARQVTSGTYENGLLKYK